MHCAVDIPGKDRVVQRPDEHALPADLVEGNLRSGVAGRVDDHLFCFDAQIIELLCYCPGLEECKFAAPGSDFYRHFWYACMSVERSLSLCAVERKLVSNCEGGMKMPASIIRSRNFPKASVSHSFTSR